VVEVSEFELSIAYRSEDIHPTAESEAQEHDKDEDKGEHYFLKHLNVRSVCESACTNISDASEYHVGYNRDNKRSKQKHQKFRLSSDLFESPNVYCKHLSEECRISLPA
jgi:hypothetical protein